MVVYPPFIAPRNRARMAAQNGRIFQRVFIVTSTATKCALVRYLPPFEDFRPLAVSHQSRT